MLFRNKLVDQHISEILNLHVYAREFVKQNITIRETLPIAQAIFNSGLTSAKIDLGKLTTDFMQSDSNSDQTFVNKKLAKLINNNESLEPKDVILYGFGRIGRLVARELIAQEGSGNQLRLRAIVTRNNSSTNITKRASLLRTDSVHGKFPGSVLEDAENKCLIINGRSVHMIASNRPENIDYTTYGIKKALVIDNTGAFRDNEALSLHLKSKGVSKVLLTAPGKGIPNIVFGCLLYTSPSPRD